MEKSVDDQLLEVNGGRTDSECYGAKLPGDDQRIAQVTDPVQKHLSEKPLPRNKTAAQSSMSDRENVNMPVVQRQIVTADQWVDLVGAYSQHSQSGM